MSIPSQSSIKSPIQLKKSSLLISRICRMIEALTKEERNELREHMDKIDTIEQDPSASNQLNQLLQFRPLVCESVEIVRVRVRVNRALPGLSVRPTLL